jgi:hypothetical protein
MIPGDYVTFTGTLLPMRTNQTKDPIAGYVDTYGTLYFKISDAIQTDGSPVTLQYIDFVKVQSGVNAMAGVFGEVSTETGIPFAAHME